MKKLMYLLLLVPFCVNAQIINFPDANFKNNLLNSTTYGIARGSNGSVITVDVNADGNIQESEALLVFELDFMLGFTMTDLTGLSYFTNLRKFRYWGQTNSTNFSVLDLTGLTNLTSVICLNNPNLTSITISDLPLLTNLDFSGCSLNTANLSNLSSINTLNFQNTQLQTLNMANCLSLVQLNLAQSKIVNVDLSGYSNLSLINLYSCHFIQNIDLSGTNISQFGWTTLSDNPVPSLRLNNCLNLATVTQGWTEFGIVEITNCPSLQQVEFPFIDLTSMFSLDVSGALNLTSLKGNFSGLKYLFMKGVNNVATMLNFNSNSSVGVSFTNSNLAYVCVNEDQVGAVESVFDNAGYTNAVVGSYCSFVPSTIYNTIAGTARLDNDSNGCDSNDLVIRNLKIRRNQLTDDTFTFTNNFGNYNFYTTTSGTQQLEPLVEISAYFDVNPVLANIDFPVIDGATFNQNFCISPNGIHNDLEVVIAPITPARPGFDATYQIVYKNKGNQTLSGNVSLTFDDARTDLVSSNPIVDNLAVNAL